MRRRHLILAGVATATLAGALVSCSNDAPAGPRENAEWQDLGNFVKVREFHTSDGSLCVATVFDRHDWNTGGTALQCWWGYRE